MPNYTQETLQIFYNQQIKQYGPSTDALVWHSEDTQRIRYDILCSDLPTTCQTIVDIGCGCGDLYHYLKSHHPPYQYKGMDISANMIVAAQQAYPNGDFTCLDLDTFSIHNRFDVVMASGIFNLRLTNHLDTLLYYIKIMLSMASQQVRFNVLTSKKTSELSGNQFVSINPLFLKKHLLQFCQNIRIIDNYLPNDVTFILNKF